MTSIKNVLGAFAFLFMAATLFAVSAPGQPSGGLLGEPVLLNSQVILTPADDYGCVDPAKECTLTASVFVFEPAKSTSGVDKREVMRQIYDECLKDAAYAGNLQGCMYAKSAQRFGTSVIENPILTPVENAHLTFRYRNSVTGAYTTVDGCGGLTADIKKTGTVPQACDQSQPDTCAPIPVDYYIAQCTIPNSLRQGQAATEIQVVFDPAGVVINNKNVQAAFATYTLTNPPTSAVQAITKQLGDLIAGIAEGQGYSGGGTTLPCVGVFLVLGLLLASLYFAGKSPVSLLDITTPKLPAPKGLAAGGQVLMPFGWSELKAANVKKMTAAGALLNKLAAGGPSTTGYERLMPKSMLPGDQAFTRSALSLGQKVGMSTQELERLAKKGVYHYGDAEHKTIAEIFKRAEALGGKHAFAASVGKDYLMGTRVQQSLETITGHAELGKRTKIMTGVEKAIKPVMNIRSMPIVAPIATAGTASIVRSFQVLGRGAVHAGVAAPVLAGRVAKTTMATLGGARAAEEMEQRFKTSAAGAWINKKMAAHPSQIVIGTMYPVTGKMAEQYRVSLNGTYRDVMEYLLQQGCKAHGMKFDLSMEELMELGYKDVDLLKRCGYRESAQLSAFLSAAGEIISNSSLAHPDKIQRLAALVDSNGGHIDRQAMCLLERLQAIERSAHPDYVKMGMVQTVLEEQGRLRMANLAGRHDADAYVCNVGTDSLQGHELARTMLFGTMIWDMEHGYGNGRISIRDGITSFQLNMINRCVGLDAVAGMEQLPEFMRNKQELEKLAARARDGMISLFTEEGRAMFQQAKGKAIGSASIQEIVNFTYGGGVERTGTIDKKTGQMVFWGADNELPLPKNATRVDIKRHWVTGLDARENFALGQWAESRFTKSYVPYFDAETEARLNRMPGSAQWSNEHRTQMAKQLLVEKLVVQDLQNRFNSQFGQNCYGGTSRETARFYAGVMAGALEKALAERGMPSNHQDLVFLQTMNVSDPGHLEAMGRLMSKYRNELEAQLSRPVTYDDVVKSNKAMVMLHEGGLAYYHKGMVLSDMDRIIGGEVSLRDDKGQLRAYKPQDVTIKFSNDALTREFERLSSSKNPKDWAQFLESVKNWANENGYSYERQKVLGAVLWQYGNTTYDYASFWNQSAVTVEAKRQVTPATPSVLRFFGIEAPGLASFLRPLTEVGRHVGDYISTVSFAASGAQVGTGTGGAFGAATRGGLHGELYGIAAMSEVHRQQSKQNAFEVLSGRALAGMTAEERIAAREYAMTHFGYHNVWEFAVDRNPWRTSTSHGAHQAWNSFFHFGPGAVYPVKDNLRGFLDRGQYANFMAFYGFPMDLAGKIMQPYTSAIRGMQMSMQGYASKWDATNDPLKQWNYTQPRLMEAFQSVNPFSFQWFPGKGWKNMSKMNVYGGSLQQHQLAGTDFIRGLSQAPQDIFLTRSGTYASARTGDTNPGLSRLDYRNVLHPDTIAAEYLFRTKEGAFMYDERMREAAFTNTVRRTVSAEALAIRRDQELHSFGVLQNQMFSLFSPVTPLWHGFPMGGPSTKDAISNHLARAKTGRSMSIEQRLESMVKGVGNKVTTLLQPHMLARTTYCPRCGMSNFRGSTCKNPACRQVQY